MIKAPIRVALDAMGGDDAPIMVVKGAEQALQQQPDLHLILVGDRVQLTDLIAKCASLTAANVRIVHTEEVVLNEDKPSIALRRGKNSSMRMAIDLVADGDADCVVSAGNTGALMAMSKMSLHAQAHFWRCQK